MDPCLRTSELIIPPRGQEFAGYRRDLLDLNTLLCGQDVRTTRRFHNTAERLRTITKYQLDRLRYHWNFREIEELVNIVVRTQPGGYMTCELIAVNNVGEQFIKSLETEIRNVLLTQELVDDSC